jgi:hypothetical protein
MAWFKGSATDYHDWLDTLKNLAKDDHILAITIYDGGTGYAVGDTITLAGGTKNHEPEIEVRGVSSGDYASGATVAAGGTGYTVGDLLTPSTGTYIVTPIIEVTSVSGGVVTGVQINNPGICTSPPTNPVTMNGGTGSGCTINFTWTAGTGIITDVFINDAGVYTVQASNPVSQNTSSGAGTGVKFTVTYTDTAWDTKLDVEPDEATGVAISVAGTGYTVNDKVTVVGGTFTEAAVVNIDSVSGGVPTAVSVYTAGEYSTTPSNPASTSGGTGSGLTLTMTWTDCADERKYLILHNTTSDQYVGFKAYKVTSPSTAYIIQVVGFTGFNSIATPWDQQPGASVADPDNEGTWVPLSGGGSPATVYYWISIQDERMVASFKVASVYPNMYAGAIDPYLTAAEYAYPQLIMGCVAQEVPYTYGGVDFAGMNNPGVWLAASSSYPGPAWLRSPDGSFKQVINWTVSAGNPLYNQLYLGVTPCGHSDNSAPAAPNAWYSNIQDWRDMFTITTTILGSQKELKRVNDEFVIIPCIVASNAERKQYGTMRGVFCINPNGVINAEDRIWINGEAYRAFQNCNKSNRNYFFVLKEY